MSSWCFPAPGGKKTEGEHARTHTHTRVGERHGVFEREKTLGHVDFLPVRFPAPFVGGEL